MSALDPNVEAALAVWFETNEPWYAGMANDVVETCRQQMSKALETASPTPPKGQAEAVALPEKLDRWLWDIREYIDGERLPDPDNAHPNDRDRFEDRIAEHPVTLAKIDAIRKYLASPAPAGRGVEGWQHMVERAFKDGIRYATNCKVVDIELAWKTSAVRAVLIPEGK